MKPRFAGASLALSLLVGCTSGYYMSGSSFTVRAPELRLTASGEAQSGTWNGRLGKLDGRIDETTQMFLPVTIEDSANGGAAGISVPYRSLLFLITSKPANGPVAAVVASDAGSIRLTGTADGEKVSGSWTLAADPAFNALFKSPPPAWASIQFILSDLKRERVRGFQEALGGGLSAKEVLRLSNSGMEPAYAAEMVRGGISREVDELVRLRNAGVPAEMPGKLKSAGYEFDTKDIVHLRNSGLSTEAAAAWKAAGFNFKASDLIRLRNAGVHPDFGKAAKDAGRDFSVEQLVRLRNAGVSPEFLREISQTCPSWGAEEIVRARNAGLNPDFIRQWTRAGYDLSLEEHIRLRNSGVPVEYAKAIGEAGGKPLPVERLIELRNKGVSPETVRSLISSGRP